jgi:hypothetical protein
LDRKRSAERAIETLIDASKVPNSWTSDTAGKIKYTLEDSKLQPSDPKKDSPNP